MVSSIYGKMAVVGAVATLATALIGPVSAVSWNRTASVTGDDFFNDFDWFTDKDPTNGLVNYQSQDNARAQNLSFVDADGQFVMAVSTVSTALAGRNSVRITSKQSYSDGVYVLNVTHVPTGCATWPSFWTVTENISNWPIGGEIDIMENANDQYPSNLVSVHTSSSCTIPQNISDQTGSVAYTNCSAYFTGNPGCRIEMSGNAKPTWGAAFNQAGGGIMAMERSFGTAGQGIRAWYFPNSAASAVPADLQAGSTSVTPDNWGKPDVHMPISSCYADFSAHKIVFDITLCGDWAGNAYNQSGCNNQFPACSYQVGYNGSSFNNSYWEISSLSLFTSGGDTMNAANSPQRQAQSAAPPSARWLSSPMWLASSTTAIVGATLIAAL